MCNESVLWEGIESCKIRFFFTVLHMYQALNISLSNFSSSAAKADIFKKFADYVDWHEDYAGDDVEDFIN